MSKKLALVLSLALAGLPTAAGALGLGEIKLNSALNDKFSADIQVVGATSDELDSLDVKLASLNQFNQAGLDHPDVLNQLQFLVVRNPDGTAYIHITSSQGVREPFLDFLIDANWNNGELIREYTVLLNPPNLQTAEAAKPQAAPAAVAPAPVPVPSAATTPVAASPAVTATAPQTEAPQPEAPVAAAPQPSAPEPTASPPASPAPSFEQAPAQRALGANYGPIHRGETLSGIAKSVRQDGVTLNQMMIAIYQANPEVFSQNINRMKAGMIMRMPSLADVQAVSVADANTEVRAQMEEWRAGRNAAASNTPEAAQPALTLVAPSSAAETSAQVPGAEKGGSGEAPAAPVSQAPAKSTKPSKPVEPAVATPVLPPPSQAPISVNSNALSSVQQQAQKQSAMPTPSALPAPATPKNVPLPTPKSEAPKPAPAPAHAASSGGGFLDAILNIYVLGALLMVGVVVVLGIVIKKRRQSAGSKLTTPARIKGADWLKQEQAGGAMGSEDSTEVASSTTRTKGKAKAKAAMQETAKFSEPPAQAAHDDDSDKTQLMSASAAQSMAETAVHDTMLGGAAASASLDVSDPMAEADFHMAYGLYDQAADVLRKALKQNPDRRDVQVKLLEVFFTAGDKNNFVSEARKLREAPGGGGKDWESVVIMGRQVAPDEPLFTSSGGGAAAVDIALEGGGTDTVVSDMDALAGAFSGMEAPGASAPEPAPAPAAAPAGDLMDFSLPDIEPTPAAVPASEAPTMVAPAAPAGDGLEFNIDDLNFEPTPAKKGREETKPTLPADEPTVATDFGTDSQVEFDKALNDLASFVNTNVPVQEAAAEPDDKTMAIKVKPAMPDTADLGTISAEEPPAAGGTSLSEVGTKLDLARAYIDMGDPEGAKSILEEVIGEGNAQQKQEAQELMKHVS